MSVRNLYLTAEALVLASATSFVLSYFSSEWHTLDLLIPGMLAIAFFRKSIYR